MAERKVLNKYYPPDFDPEDLPRNKRDKFQTAKVRMMLPMSIRCNTCGEYLYRGKKFNSIKETVLGEDYLGIKIYRFYMRCTRCSAEFTIKTDPQKCDYEAENNCSRNFEPWRQQNEEIEKIEKEKKEEEGDAMKRLENRTLESKIEMDILDGLDTIKSMNAKIANVPIEKVLEQRNKKIQQEEEEIIKGIVFQNSTNFVRRIKEDEENNNSEKKNNVDDNESSNSNNTGKDNSFTSKKSDFIKIDPPNKKKIGASISAPPIIVKKRKNDKEEEKGDGGSIFDLLEKKNKPNPKKNPPKKIAPKKVAPKKNVLTSLVDY